VPNRRFHAIAVLSLVAMQAAVSFWGASRTDYVGNYDTAYYYAVARNIAQGRVNCDDVLWHWLGSPDAVARPAGDYWSPGWPLLLGSLMAVAGSTMKHAIWICAVLSLALPVLAFWAAWAIRRSLPVAWLAGAMVVFQERMIPSDFIPDVALPMQLSVMLGLCLLLAAQRSEPAARSPWILAGFALAAPFWLRGDGFVVGVAAAAAILLAPQLPPRARVRRTGWLLAGAAACVIPFLAYNVWAFGTVTPAPRTMVPFMKNFLDLYRFETDPSAAAFASGGVSKLSWISFAVRERMKGLPEELPLPLLALALMGCFIGGERRSREGRTLPFSLLIVLFMLVPAILAPATTTNPSRFLQVTAPIVCVLAALAIGRLTPGLESFRITASAAALALALSCILWFWPLQIRNPLAPARWNGAVRPIPEYLAAEKRPALMPGDVVLTTDPWQVSAVLGLPSVMIPIDSAAAVRAVAAKYGARYLLVVRKSHWFDHARADALKSLFTELPTRRLQATEGGVWFEIGHLGRAAPEH